MTEKTVSIRKNRFIVFILSFLLICLKSLHSAALRGMLQTDILLAAAAGAFAFAFVMSMNLPADGKALSMQNLIGVISVAGAVLGVFNYMEINVEVFAAFAVFAGGLMFVKEIRLLPAAAALAILAINFFQYTTPSSIPMFFAAGFVLNWNKIKESSVVDKIIFGVSEASLLVCSLYTLKVYGGAMSVDSFKAYWLYAIPTFLMIALLVFVAVKAFKSKSGKIEAVGYIFCAVAAFPLTCMSSRYVYLIIASLGLTLIVMANGETFAKKTLCEINEAIEKKLCK